MPSSSPGQLCIQIRDDTKLFIGSWVHIVVTDWCPGSPLKDVKYFIGPRLHISDESFPCRDAKSTWRRSVCSPSVMSPKRAMRSQWPLLQSGVQCPHTEAMAGAGGEVLHSGVGPFTNTGRYAPPPYKVKGSPLRPLQPRHFQSYRHSPCK